MKISLKFALEGKQWKDLRAKLTPTFTSGKMKMMFGTVSKICDGMIDYLKPTGENGGIMEMKEVLSSFTTEGGLYHSSLHVVIFLFIFSQLFHPLHLD